tara:strand:- start:3533 stop:4939 length:1407 start_codon:yes stop_codon:yes gene_type:complete
MKRSFKIVFQVFFILVFIFGCKKTDIKSKSKEKPNVLLILTDDLGYGDISCFGQENYKTPHIDNIAAEGVSSTAFYVPTPYCAPSRATLLTGRFPLRHGLVKNPTPDASVSADTIGLSTAEVTMAEVFREAGYATKMIGKWHLGHKEKYFPVNQGFEEYYGILYSNDMRPVQIIENRDTVQYPVDQRFLTKDYTEKAIDFIKRKKDAPFFLYLAHAMPHKPLAASEQFYSPETPDDLYADVIRELDWSIGEVMATLKELKILENTIVIFMSDNGPWYGGSSGGFKGMKATTWEGGIRVPFMIRYPKIFPENKKVDVPLWSPDIFPTLFSLTGITPSESKKLDGHDITEILQGKIKSHPPVFSMHNNEIMSIRKGDMKLFVNRPRAFTVRDFSNWKDSRGPDGTTILAQMEGQASPADYPGVLPEKPKNKIQLFDLKNDPTESNDLALSKPEIVKELLKEYIDYKEDLK